MSSSTFTSSPLRRERTLRTLLVLSVALGGMALWLPPPDSTATRRTGFWDEKKSWHGRFTGVVAGDSRVYRGVVPSVLEEAFPGTEFGNFGFSSAGFGAEYLEGVERALRPPLTGRVILLGITPHSLTQGALRENGFKSAAHRPWWDAALVRWTKRWVPGAQALLDSGSVSWKARLGSTSRRSDEVYHPDGWVESAPRPATPETGLAAYGAIFEDNPVATHSRLALAEAVRRWSAAGARVFCFRPPSSPAMRALEDARSGFVETVISSELSTAGCRWLSFPERYESYDASHLDAQVAARFTRDLATSVGSAAGLHSMTGPP